ncbi:MAG: cytochrome c3 family protein [Bryobacteraceae bacterium]
MLTVFGPAMAQTAAPFSHRVHLALKLECTRCHAAAPVSTRLEDNLLPKAEVCRECHKTEPNIGSPPTTRLERFNHQLHLKLGNIAPAIAAAIDHKQYLSPPPPSLREDLNTRNSCEACHRGLETSDRPEHTALPQMADCLVCHNQIAPPDSCQFCHAKSANLKPATHTADFLDTHTSGKLALDKTTCAVCHGRHFTCLGCH